MRNKLIQYTCSWCSATFVRSTRNPPRGQRVFCSTEHYHQSRLEPPSPENFWRRAQPQPSGCLIWAGETDPAGYGKLKYCGKKHLAHRIAWLLAHGAIPEDRHVLHVCDTPSCVNPKHLFLGTDRDNMRDMTAKQRGWWQRPDPRRAALWGIIWYLLNHPVHS